ncbi:MAG TPA: SpoIIE family protein phosphatase, partial [Patescibacteria group bacterium]|nr:SpoIIE family protein phosphatase [Patescibacteria group bacterium]
ASVPVHPGDTLLIFSDGISEAQNDAGDEFGENRIAEIVSKQSDSSAVQIIDIVMQAVRDFTGDKPQFDDMTLLVVKRRTG